MADQRMHEEDNTDVGQRTDDAAVAPGLAKPIGVLGVGAILFRWLPLLIPIAGLVLYGAVMLTSEIDPEYTAEASVLLTGPSEVLVVDPETGVESFEEVNPLTTLGGSLATVASVTAIAMTDDAVIEQLEEEGLSPYINVVHQSRTPIITVFAVDNDAELVTATTDRIVAMIQDDLQERQDDLNAPPEDRVFAQPVSGSTVGPADFGGRTRVRLALAAAGLGLTVAFGFLLEGIYQLYRQRRRRRFASLAETELQDHANVELGSLPSGHSRAPIHGPIYSDDVAPQSETYRRDGLRQNDSQRSRPSRNEIRADDVRDSVDVDLARDAASNPERAGQPPIAASTPVVVTHPADDASSIVKQEHDEALSALLAEVPADSNQMDTDREGGAGSSAEIPTVDSPGFTLHERVDQPDDVATPGSVPEPEPAQDGGAADDDSEDSARGFDAGRTIEIPVAELYNNGYPVGPRQSSSS